MKPKKITIYESLPRGDSMNKGFVEVYAKIKGEDKKLVAKSNLIVYTGREWLLSRIFNKNNTDLSYYNDNKDWFISWISFGDGGAPTTDPLNPNPPLSTDTELCHEIVIGNNTTLYADGGKKKPIQDLSFVQDNANSNRYLIAQANVTLDETEANNININEAGLWIANSDKPEADPNKADKFQLFAHVTFPSIVKSTNLALQILWYIYS